MGLIGHMVTRNELGRYLPDTLAWLAALTNGRLLVYDDRSDDGTDAYIARTRLPLVQRDQDTPPFAEDESACRAAGWAALEQLFEPTEDDWILCVDADEFIVSTNPAGSSIEAIQAALARITQTAEDSITFRVPEVFGFNAEGNPMIRTDGYWDSITANRMARWRPGGRFYPRKEGGGSLPSNWPKASHSTSELALLHYGYARPEDRDVRYQRYRSGIGHNPMHIASIQRPPSLTPWTGMEPTHQ